MRSVGGLLLTLCLTVAAGCTVLPNAERGRLASSEYVLVATTVSETGEAPRQVETFRDMLASRGVLFGGLRPMVIEIDIFSTEGGEERAHVLLRDEATRAVLARTLTAYRLRSAAPLQELAGDLAADWRAAPLALAERGRLVFVRVPPAPPVPLPRRKPKSDEVEMRRDLDDRLLGGS